MNRENRISLQQPGEIGVIDWPVTGDKIQGTVVIRGSTPQSGLRSYEIDYALSNDPDQDWHLIQEGTSSIQSGILAVWDTTALSDGEYNLRLLSNLTNGHQSVTNMYNLSVQNAVTPQPTSPPATAWYFNLTGKTPTPTQAYALAQAMPAELLSEAPTQLPGNPVEISTSKAIKAILGGAVVSIVIFSILGGVIAVRYLLNRRG